MLTRRAFSGFVSCAICAIASEFIASEASAQAGPPAAASGVTRKILSQTDGPTAGYVTLLVEATIEPGAMVARHTHPGSGLSPTHRPLGQLRAGYRHYRVRLPGKVRAV